MNTAALVEEREKEALDRLIRDTARRVERTMEELGVVHWQRRDLEYLIWLQWARRVGVSLEQVIKKVVTEYRRRLQKKGPALGVSMSTLTGDTAGDWLEEAFRRELIKQQPDTGT